MGWGLKNKGLYKKRIRKNFRNGKMANWTQTKKKKTKRKKSTYVRVREDLKYARDKCFIKGLCRYLDMKMCYTSFIACREYCNGDSDYGNQPNF